MTAVATRPTSSRWGLTHLPALDGLRGAAVAAVLVYHLGHLEGGYLGVDLFFVLSGFLITSLLLGEEERRGKVALGDFWARRARRLLPALLLLLWGVAAYAHWFARPVDFDSIRADGLATVLYVANWHTIAQGQSYWDISLAPSPLQHAWSLAIEEQFYLVWPLVVVWVAKRAKHGLDRAVFKVAAWGAVAAAVWLVALYSTGASVTRVYQGTDTRAAAVLGGAALAAWHRLHPLSEVTPSQTARVRAAGVAAVAALGACWIWLPGTSPWLYRGGLAVTSALAVVVIASVVRGGRWPLSQGLSVLPLRGMGLISYGLYLWHWPVYQAIDVRNGRLPFLGDTVVTGPSLVLLKLSVTFAIALLSYVLVEQPIRHSNLRGVPLLLVSLAAMAVTAVVLVAATAGGVTVPGQGGEGRGPTEVIPGAPEVLYVGDSVALSLVESVVADPPAFGVNPVDRAVPGCSPVAQGRKSQNFGGRPSEPPPCFPGLDAELPGMHPDAIVVLVGARPNDYVQIEGEWVRACDPRWVEAYEGSMLDLVARLRTSGAPVTLGTIARTSDHSSIRLEGADERVACANEALARVVEQVPGSTLVDMNDLICPDPGACIEEFDGDVVRPDGLHFGAGPAGQRVSHWLLDQALAAADVQAAPTN